MPRARLKFMFLTTNDVDVRSTPALTSARNDRGRYIIFSTRDPENAGLEGKLATLSTLLAVLKEIESSVGEAGKAEVGNNNGSSITRADLVMRPPAFMSHLA